MSLLMRHRIEVAFELIRRHRERHPQRHPGESGDDSRAEAVGSQEKKVVGRVGSTGDTQSGKEGTSFARIKGETLH